MWFRRLLRRAREVLSDVVGWIWQIGFLVTGFFCRRESGIWSDDRGLRVLVVSPHPDDESIACAGTIRRHIEAGHKVTIAIVTDGRKSRRAATPEEMAAIRKREARLAADSLGVRQLEWFGLHEGNWLVDELRVRLTRLIEIERPNVIYAPSRVDFHPEHFAVAHAIACALRDLDEAAARSIRIRIYEVQVPLTGILSNLTVDTSGCVEHSSAALAAYASQAGSIRFLRRRRRYSMLMQRRDELIEEFWELPAAKYVEIHQDMAADWGKTFRGIRAYAWTDPLAYWKGTSERLRLRRLVDGTER